MLIQDQIFQFLELLGNIPLRIGKCLLTNVIIRDKILERVCDFQRIPEYAVIFYLQIFDSGALFFPHFQLRQPFFSVCAGTTEFIDENALQVNLTRLKKTMTGLGMKQKILPVRGVGYRLESGEHGYEG